MNVFTSGIALDEFNYTLHNHILEVTKDSKYLGVTFSSDLSWTSHINNISAKANRTIGFLRRNMHSYPKEVKASAYTTLVRPSIEYASSVWDPYTRNNIQQLEAIQNLVKGFRKVKEDGIYLFSTRHVLC
jgi:hypothetical protein